LEVKTKKKPEVNRKLQREHFVIYGLSLDIIVFKLRNVRLNWIYSTNIKAET
jgi:hypothetical protein